MLTIWGTDRIEPKWIRFDYVGRTEKTAIFNVVSVKHGDILGQIKWFGKWRQYAFEPAPKTTFDRGCLRNIIGFIDQLMKDRRYKGSD